MMGIMKSEAARSEYGRKHEHHQAGVSELVQL